MKYSLHGHLQHTSLYLHRDLSIYLSSEVQVDDLIQLFHQCLVVLAIVPQGRFAAGCAAAALDSLGFVGEVELTESSEPHISLYNSALSSC